MNNKTEKVESNGAAAAVAVPRETVRVAIQGIATSFHEVAGKRYFDASADVETVECLSFHELCESLDRGGCDYAVMAIENSIAGSILPNYFLLQSYHFKIIGELYLPIHMHLLALPGVKREDIRVVESHPMAIRQCAEYINALPGVQVRESDDTALSAKRVQELGLKDTAAIANEFAARKYGLEIIDKRIETHKKNFTRFLILSKRNQLAGETDKASLSFEVAHEVGSLADTLMVFKNHKINLTKIQSIPVIGKPSEYSIHVDVEWKQRKSYDDAIHEILRQVRNLNILGEYKKAKIEYS
jgi:prephenate dehydratase